MESRDERANPLKKNITGAIGPNPFKKMREMREQKQERKWRAEMREREKSTDKMRDERQRRDSRDKILLFFLQYCYSAILSLELHCSKYCKKFIILAFTIF